jgi:hypothetical protein
MVAGTVWRRSTWTTSSRSARQKPPSRRAKPNAFGGKCTSVARLRVLAETRLRWLRVRVRVRVRVRDACARVCFKRIVRVAFAHQLRGFTCTIAAAAVQNPQHPPHARTPLFGCTCSPPKKKMPARAAVVGRRGGGGGAALRRGQRRLSESSNA